MKEIAFSSGQKAHGVRRWFRNSVARTFQKLGVNGMARKLKTGPVVLYYHGVEREIIDSQIQGIHLPLALFEKHVEYLRRHFDIVSLPYLWECMKNGFRLDPSSVLLTFDDGYKNNVEFVLPFLKSLEIPFAVFISTRHIDQGLRFPTFYLRAALFSTEKTSAFIPSLDLSFDLGTRERRIEAKNVLEADMKKAPQELAQRILKDVMALVPPERWPEIEDRFHSDEPMNWNDVKTLAASGVTIGSHCLDHFILHARQEFSEMERQIEKSKETIAEHLGHCRFIAYPEGGANSLNPQVIPAVERSGYELGFTCLPGEISDTRHPLLLPRVGTPGDINHFRFNLNASYRFNRFFQRWREHFMSSLDQPECP